MALSTNAFTTVGLINDCRSFVDNIDGRADIEEVLQLATFMNRVAVIKNFFELCQRSVACFKADPRVIGTTVPGGDDFARPLRHFIVEFYRRHLVGLPSLCLATSVVSFVHANGGSFGGNLKESTKSVIDAKTSYPVTKEKVNFLSLNLKALTELLEKMIISLAMEKKVEAVNAYLQVI